MATGTRVFGLGSRAKFSIVNWSLSGRSILGILRIIEYQFLVVHILSVFVSAKRDKKNLGFGFVLSWKWICYNPVHIIWWAQLLSLGKSYNVSRKFMHSKFKRDIAINKIWRPNFQRQFGSKKLGQSTWIRHSRADITRRQIIEKGNAGYGIFYFEATVLRFGYSFRFFSNPSTTQTSLLHLLRGFEIKPN